MEKNNQKLKNNSIILNRILNLLQKPLVQKPLKDDIIFLNEESFKDFLKYLYI